MAPECSAAYGGGGELAVDFYWLMLCLHLREFHAWVVALDIPPGGLDGTAGIPTRSSQNALRISAFGEGFRTCVEDGTGTSLKQWYCANGPRIPARVGDPFHSLQ